tara:strand:+ start:180 stop:485 length:306 start_codon:yes stop_codon:yes gene_type:complete
MAFTIDPRPIVFGNKVMITGTFDGTDGADSALIDLGEFMTSIDFAIANGGVAPLAFVTIDSKNIWKTFSCAYDNDSAELQILPLERGSTLVAGTWMAIGSR